MGNVIFTPTISGVGNWAISVTISLPGGKTQVLNFNQRKPNAQTVPLAPGIYPLQLNGNGPQAAPGSATGAKTLTMDVDGSVMVDKSHDYQPGAFFGDSMTIDAV